MKIQVESLSPVEKKVLVEVDAERVARELDRAYAALGRRVKLRGFRPGKAPRQVLERNFRDEVERDVSSRLVELAFGEAVSDHGVQAVAPPRADIAEPGLQPAQPFRFTVRVEVKPRLEPRDYKGLEVKRRPAAVTDEMVSDELKRLQEAFARFVPVEGRDEAAEGDYALVDHEGTVEGRSFEGGKAEGVTVRVAPGDFFAGFFPQLAGLRIGQTRDIEQAFPAGFRVEALRNKVAHFRVILRGLQSRQVPPLDDAFAKDLAAAGIETLEQLRADLRKKLDDRERHRERSETNDALVRAALARNDFEVPPALVERAIDSMLEGAAQRFARQGLDMRQMELDIARLRGDLREQALLQVRSALLLEAVAEAEKIEPSDADLEAEIARVASENGIPVEKLRPQLRGAESRAALRSRVREDQVLAFLAAHAKIEDAAPAG
jgi:trigger factor